MTKETLLPDDSINLNGITTVIDGSNLHIPISQNIADGDVVSNAVLTENFIRTNPSTVTELVSLSQEKTEGITR